MVKSNVSELVALGMNETLENEEFQHLFGVAYKKAGHGCKENHDHTSECGDASYADDNAADVKPPPKPLSFDPNFGATPVPGPDPKQPGALSADDTSFADDDNDVDDDDNDADDDTEEDDTEEDTKKQAALELAIEGLLRVSAALDSVGFEKSATTTLNLAGLMSEAKKKVDDKKKKKEDKKKKKGKNPFAKGNSSSSSKGSSSKSDSNDARDAKAKAKKKKEKEEEEAKAKKKKEQDTQAARDKKAKEAEKEKKAREAEKEAKKKKEEAAKKKK